MQASERHRAHWRATLQLTAGLLAIWFFVTFVLGYFARELTFTVFGWPFSFWLGAQGALVVYVLIIGCYAYCMNRLDRQHGLSDDDDA